MSINYIILTDVTLFVINPREPIYVNLHFVTGI